MANVMFKRGTQAALETLKTSVANNNATFVDGAFYLTTDTDRLYVAQSTTELVELNQSIINISQIQSDGQGGYTVTEPTGGIRPVKSGEFYYLADGNILMIGQDNGKLLQVNHDTYLNSVSTQVGTNGTAVNVLHTLTPNSGTAKTLTTNFVGGNRINVAAVGGDTVQINAATSTYVATLPEGSTTASQATLTVNGEASVVLKSNTSNGVIFSKDGDALKLTLPDAIAVPAYTMVGGSNDSHETVNLQKDGNAQSTVTLGETKVNYGFASASSTATKSATTSFIDGVHTFDLDIYSREQVDAKISDIASAMDYRGAATAVPATGDGSGDNGALVAGDMWKAQNGFTIPAAKSGTGAAATVKNGDLIIVNSEGTFDVIPSGDDQNISITTTTKTLTVHEGISNSALGQIQFDSQSANSAISFDSTTNSGGNLTVKADLKAINPTTASASATPGYAGTVNAISAIAVDAYGRVTSYTSTAYSLPAAPTLSITGGADSSTTPPTGVLTFSLSTGSSAVVKSESLSISHDNNTNTAKIELVWGSF